jgi:tRNA-Thr(GGU) m(6)t(6)A37 methyltransferase TsaA
MRKKAMQENICIEPIGIIYSPFKKPKGTPIQSSSAIDIKGKIVIYEKYTPGLKDLEGFSHIILMYYFHLIRKTSLIVKPFLDEEFRGVFSTRAPVRPNHLGISIVRLEGIDKQSLYIKDVDIVDKTPLIDIKPYCPEFDTRQVEKIGWLDRNISKLNDIKDDGRFRL